MGFFRQKTKVGCHFLLQGIFLIQGLELGFLHFRQIQSHQVEGNGTPLQYSCLENPMDGGAWWAAVHGVTKSPT